MNLRHRNQNITYYSGICNSDANVNLLENKLGYMKNKDFTPNKINQVQYYSYFKGTRVGGNAIDEMAKTQGTQFFNNSYKSTDRVSKVSRHWGT